MTLPFTRAANVIAREEAGTLILFEQEHGRIYTMNETAKFIWEHCDGRNSTEDIANMVQHHFLLPEEIDRVSLAEIVSQHLVLLEKAALIERSYSEPSMQGT